MCTQVRVQAYDMGGEHTRNSSGEARVRLTVKRNKYAPTFKDEYEKTILQSQEELENFMSVKASDRDDEVGESIPFKMICIKATQSG